MMKVLMKCSLVFVLAALPTMSHADRQAAMDAVDAVLFDLDKIGVEYINFRVDGSANVSMTVDDTVPENLYGELLDRLRAHKDINSVLASQGPVCPIPYVSNRE